MFKNSTYYIVRTIITVADKYGVRKHKDITNIITFINSTLLNMFLSTFIIFNCQINTLTFKNVLNSNAQIKVAIDYWFMH